MVEGKKRITAKRKLEVCLETRQKDAIVGEILRRYGLRLNDLRRLEPLMERAALDALKGRPCGEQGAALNGKEYAELVAELAQKEKALAELTVKYTLLKKSERLGWRMASTSTATDGRR